MEDLERNDGKDKPYFMSKKLMKLLNAKNKKNKGRDATDGEEEVIELDEHIHVWENKKLFIHVAIIIHAYDVVVILKQCCVVWSDKITMMIFITLVKFFCKCVPFSSFCTNNYNHFIPQEQYLYSI